MEKSDSLKNIFINLPGEIGLQIRNLPENIMSNMEELRLKIGKPIYIYSGGKEYQISSNSVGVSRELINTIFNNLLNYSIYAYQEEIAKGYITIEGGHRVGLCGKTVIENGVIRTIKDISSLNVRRSREIIGVSDFCIQHIMENQGEIYNTLIVSPPKCGKTTLLRDLIRNLSINGFKIGLCDERSEISGIYLGTTSYDLGSRTDILDGCPKSEGIMMLIRSMSPHIIATDEIGRSSDVEALESAVCAGIRVLTTIHGNSYNDLIKSGVGKLIENNYFERLIYLSNNPKTGTIEKITDGKGEILWS